MAVRIECVELVKRFGAAIVLDRLSWTVDAGDAVALVGQSGAGKTTLLRLLAGLDAPTEGSLQLVPHEESRSPRRVSIGMMFQDLALWPHLTVGQHLACVLWRLPSRERRRRAEEAFRAVRLPDSAWDRRPSQLSGGEAQRVALARALAPRPELLLFDEPLAQIDVPLRGSLLELIRQTVADARTTAVYVTHRWAEATALCRRVAVMSRGRIVADGPPEEIFWRPPSGDVARLSGPVVEVPETWLSQRRVAVAQDAAPAAGGFCRESDVLLVRPQQVRFIEPRGANRWMPLECRPDGAAWCVVVENQGERLTTSAAQPAPLGQPVGVEVRVEWLPFLAIRRRLC